MPLTAIDLITLSRLLDEALDLDPAQTEAWLASLTEEQLHLRPRLREMLAAHRAGGHPSFMASGPTFGGGPADETVARADERVGPYRLIREIGRGGMSTVWLADRADGTLKREVALKLPRLAWGTGLAERMARERDIGALLEHPNIARLYDAGVDALGRPYLALEYIEGQHLDTWCEAQALSIRDRLRLVVQIARAVAYAHGRLVVHRDLKPSNVLVTADGQAHLLDFGIAKLLSEARPTDNGLTQEQGRVLTPHYASPEQLEGQTITVASDVYSLGVLLYGLLTGRHPHEPDSKSLAAIESAILHDEPPLASRRARDKSTAKALRGELDAILAKALRRAPTQRYATADAFAEDVQRYLNGDAVLAQPDSWRYRSGKTLRRHRLAFAALGAVLLALLGGAAAVAMQAQRTFAAAERARVVKEFVIDVFKVNERGNPANSDLRALPAELLLERGARLIRARFAGQVDLQAELYGVVARILLDMRSEEVALEFASNHVDALNEGGADGDSLASGELLFAQALLANAYPDGAQLFARRALAHAMQAEAQIEARLVLAEAMRTTGQTSQAFVELDQVDSRLRSDAAPDRMLRVKAAELRARTLVSLGQFDRARPLFERAIADTIATEGAQSRRAAEIRVGLAQELANAGFTEGARAAYRDAVAVMRASGGADDVEAALFEADAALQLAWGGAVRVDEADAAANRALKVLDLHGTRYPPWVRARIENGNACLAVRFGRPDKGNLYETSALLRATFHSPRGFQCLPLLMLTQEKNRWATERVSVWVMGMGSHTPRSLAFVQVTRAVSHLMDGHLDAARAALPAARPSAAAPQTGQPVAPSNSAWAALAVQATRARIELEAGRPEETLRLLQGTPDATFLVNDTGFIRGEAMCKLGRLREGLALMHLRIAEGDDGRDGDLRNPWLADLRARLGLCELAAGHRPAAAALAVLARQPFQRNPAISHRLKTTVDRLDLALRQRTGR